MSETIQLKSTYEGAEVYATDPLVAVRSNVISPIECAYLIELAKPHIKRAGVVLDDGYKPSDGRTGSNHWLRFDEDDVVHSIGKRIADIVGLPLENAESMQIIHYGPEQEYRPHFDAFNLTLPRGQKAAQWGGQRLVTALVYLNKVEGGGATQFPKLGITVPASPGRMVIFHNTTTDISGPHPLSLHAGMPVEAGEKWAFNLWFRLHDTRESFDAVKALPSVVFGSSSSNPAMEQDQVTQVLNTAKDQLSDTAAPQSASNSVPKAQDDQPQASQPQVTQAQVAQSQLQRPKATPTAAAASTARPAGPESLWVVANRADALWQRAVKTLKARDNRFPAVHVSYWDSFGNKPQPDTPEGWSGPVFSTVSRSVLNPLSDLGHLLRRLTDLDLARHTPATFASAQEALKTHPKVDDLWFIRSQFKGANDKTLCVPTPIMAAATLPTGSVLQKATDNLALIDQHKFTARVYIAIIGEQLLRYEEPVVFVHGGTYAPNDANHASQVDHRSYRDAGSTIQLIPGSQTIHAEAIEAGAAALTRELTTLFDKVRTACADGAFTILALDTLLTKSNELVLMRIHTFPNFITTAQIDADVHVPLFEDVLRVMAGVPSRKLTTITN